MFGLHDIISSPSVGRVACWSQHCAGTNSLYQPLLSCLLQATFPQTNMEAHMVPFKTGSPYRAFLGFHVLNP